MSAKRSAFRTGWECKLGRVRKCYMRVCFCQCFCALFLSDVSPGWPWDKERASVASEPLPTHVLARLGTGRFRHGTRCMQVSFSPDGKMLISLGNDRRLRLWDAKTGLERHSSARVFDSEIHWFGVSSSRMAIHERAGRLKVVSYDFKEVGSTVWEKRGAFSLLAISSRGDVLAAVNEGEQRVEVLNGGDGTRLAILVGHEGAISALAFSADNKVLA